tara:strand:- start:1263 stop:1811 length:549 start_codon:yes stop_codon:yes gene_type:complete
LIEETRKCRVCQKVKPLTAKYFNKRLENKTAPPFRWDCKICYNAYKRTHPGYFERKMLQHARNRARINSREFDITIDDISIPSHCPVLGIKLVHGWDDDESCPTLERIDNNVGYVSNNVMVVSALANRVKSSATWQQIIQVGNFYKDLDKNKRKTEVGELLKSIKKIIIRQRMKELKKRKRK